MELVSSLAAKIVDLDELRKENAELRQLLNKPLKAPPTNRQHLIVADFSMDNASAIDPDTTEIAQCMDMTYQDTIQVLSDRSK